MNTKRPGGEMADTLDSKSGAPKACGFKSRPGYFSLMLKSLRTKLIRMLAGNDTWIINVKIYTPTIDTKYVIRIPSGYYNEVNVIGCFERDLSDACIIPCQPKNMKQ